MSCYFLIVSAGLQYLRSVHFLIDCIFTQRHLSLRQSGLLISVQDRSKTTTLRCRSISCALIYLLSVWKEALHKEEDTCKTHTEVCKYCKARSLHFTQRVSLNINYLCMLYTVWFWSWLQSNSDYMSCLFTVFVTQYVYIGVFFKLLQSVYCMSWHCNTHHISDAESGCCTHTSPVQLQLISLHN